MTERIKKKRRNKRKNVGVRSKDKKKERKRILQKSREECERLDIIREMERKGKAAGKGKVCKAGEPTTRR